MIAECFLRGGRNRILRVILQQDNEMDNSGLVDMDSEVLRLYSFMISIVDILEIAESEQRGF